MEEREMGSWLQRLMTIGPSSKNSFSISRSLTVVVSNNGV